MAQTKNEVTTTTIAEQTEKNLYYVLMVMQALRQVTRICDYMI